MQRRLLATVAILTGIGLAVSGCSAASSNPSDGAADGVSTFKIGAFAPLTGEHAENGQNIIRSYELYAEQINAAGGVDGRQVELVVRDDRGEPKTAANIAQEFAEDKSIIATLGSFTSTATMAAAPILEKAGIPNISPTSSHPDYTAMGEFMFRGTDTQATEAKSVSEYADAKFDKNDIAVIYRLDDWGMAAAENFQKGVEDSGGKLVDSKGVAPDTRDFRTVVTSLKSANPGTLFVALQYADAAVLAQQIAASGWTPNVITTTALYSAKLVELSGENVEGWHIPTFFLADSEKAHIQKFVGDYQAKYDSMPDAFSAVAYDAISILGEAAKTLDLDGKSIEEDRVALRDALFEVKVDGQTGEMEFDAQGDVRKPMSWLVIQDGQFVPEK